MCTKQKDPANNSFRDPVKQSEIDRYLKSLAKAEATRRGWKSVAGMPYWSTGPLFFVLVQTAGAKEGYFHASLRFKWLSLDNLLWKVLGIASNEQGPFSLHANGVFSLTGQEVLTISNSDLQWLPGVLEQQIVITAENAFQRACDISTQITSINSYLKFIQNGHQELMQKFPKAVVNVWKEECLVALETGDAALAVQIADKRIAAGDSGGFICGGKSFYQNVLSFCRQ